MNFLIDQLPEGPVIDGAEYDFNADFRTSILYELLMQDDDVNDEDKLAIALALYYPQIPEDIEAATDYIIWFYSLGKFHLKDLSQPKESKNEGKTDRVRSYSFEDDDKLIYAAFYSQYHIDLQETDLHWWKFRALFAALHDTEEFSKVVGYRSVKISNKMSKEQQSFYKKMKKLHALSVSDVEKTRQEKLVEALKKGSDVSDLL